MRAKIEVEINIRTGDWAWDGVLRGVFMGKDAQDWKVQYQAFDLVMSLSSLH
jgi:hypothetical protein